MLGLQVLHENGVPYENIVFANIIASPEGIDAFTKKCDHTISALHPFSFHSFTPSLLHSFTPSLLHPFTPSLTHVRTTQVP